ncbi:MAG: hypothetical protein ACTSYA_01720 [Candidatus Kariarchaeaceae archaeon]
MTEEEIIDDLPKCPHCGTYEHDYYDYVDAGSCKIICGFCGKVYFTEGIIGLIFTSATKEESL